MSTAGRYFVNGGNIQIAVERQAERARNRRRSHNQQVWVAAFADQALPLRHSKSVLFVNDDQPEIFRGEA